MVGPDHVVALAVSAVLLIGFVTVEGRVAHPLLPLHIVRDRAAGRLRDIALAGRRVRGLPIPDLLHAAEPRLLAVEDRPRIPADDRHDRPHRHDGADRVLPRTGAKPLVVTGMTLGLSP